MPTSFRLPLPKAFRPRHVIAQRSILGMLLLCALPSVAAASCNIPGMRVSIAASDWLLRRPTQLLERHPKGEHGLMGEVMAFATNSATLKPVVTLGMSANSPQRKAIGEGLGRAAFLCQRYDLSVSRTIRDLVETLGDTELKSSFRQAYQLGATSVPSMPGIGGTVSDFRPRPPNLNDLRQTNRDDERSSSTIGMPSVRSGETLEIKSVPAMPSVLKPIK